MSWFFHSRKIDDLDELSNKANASIRAGQWDEAERLCRKLREQFPEEIDADDRLAQLYQAQKNYLKALPFAQAALDRAQHNPDKFAPELVDDLTEQVALLKKKAGL
jgi:tetratricopeptide (TPR) repeat protein